MSLGTRDVRRPSNGAQRPPMVSSHSTSLPSTPRQHPRDYTFKSRSPSPPLGNGGHSPRSVSSESNRTMASLRPTNPACRYQSTQTSRRRINYTIGSEVLGSEPNQKSYGLDSPRLARIEKRVIELYKSLLPTPESQENRKKVVEKLSRILSHEWPDGNVNVVVFGSSGNLLCTSKSDVDICITMKGLETVCALADVLAKKGMRNVTCVHAKSVPIVKLWDPELQMACDLNVNNHVAIKNTRMVKTYMEIDERVRVLAMIVKYWTKQRILNEASGGTLSSYTWTLLVIFFLQTRKPPILPVVSLRDDKGQHKSDFGEDLERFRGFGRENTESNAELLFHFFRRYGHELDYESTVVSVRQGKSLSKREKNWHLATNNRLCVEEPFNTERNLGNTADDTAVRGLHLELRQAFTRLTTGEDLESRVCERFEFPKEQYRAIFEKPNSQARPVITRSTSHSSRANRNTTIGRNNRNRTDNRQGMNGRRSSSAAAYGSHSFPNLGSPRQLIAPHADYFFQPQPPGMTPEDLDRLKQRLSTQEQELRYRQLLMSHQSVQEAHAVAANQKRGSNSPMMSHHRSTYNSYPSPRISNFESIPGSAPLYHGYPVNPRFESAVAMSPSSSQQESSTNPSSPLLPTATPARRGFQRAPQISPGTAIRSHSQPARPLAPPLPVAGRPHVQYSSTNGPNYYQGRSDQTSAAGAPRLVYGPFMGPSGAYCVYTTAETVPREYLGYGIGGAPPFATLPMDPSLYNSSSYEDVSSLRRGQASPTARPNSLVGSTPVRRSPSPSAFGREPMGGMKSAPLSTNFLRQAEEPGRRRAAEDPGPIIVNGSYHTSPSSRANADLQAQEMQSVSEIERPLRPRPNFFADDSDSELNSHLQPGQHMTASRIRQGLVENTPNGPNQLNYNISKRATSDETSSSSSNNPFIAQSGPGRSESVHESRLTSVETSLVGMEASGPIHDRHRRLSASARQNITPLDLSAPATDRPREPPPGPGPLLSPVEETRTPSPTSTRKVESRRHSQLNGSRGSRDSIDSTLMAGPPPQGSKINGKENQYGLSNRASPNHSAASTSTQSSQITPSNTWQQAGRTSRKKDNRRSRGEPMPANEAERKGG